MNGCKCEQGCCGSFQGNRVVVLVALSTFIVVVWIVVIWIIFVIWLIINNAAADNLNILSLEQILVTIVLPTFVVLNGNSVVSGSIAIRVLELLNVEAGLSALVNHADLLVGVLVSEIFAGELVARCPFVDLILGRSGCVNFLLALCIAVDCSSHRSRAFCLDGTQNCSNCQRFHFCFLNDTY